MANAIFFFQKAFTLYTSTLTFSFGMIIPDTERTTTTTTPLHQGHAYNAIIRHFQFAVSKMKS